MIAISSLVNMFRKKIFAQEINFLQKAKILQSRQSNSEFNQSG
jgi:hypothetical protein